MKKAIVITAWIVGALIGIAILNLIGNSDTKPISETNPSEKLISQSEQFEKSFIGGCVKGGGSQSECQCMWSKMKAKWTQAEIDSIATEYSKTNKMPEALTAMAVECVE